MRKDLITALILCFCLLAAISGCNSIEEQKADTPKLSEAEITETEAEIEQVSKTKTIEASSVANVKTVSDVKDAIIASTEKIASTDSSVPTVTEKSEEADKTSNVQTITQDSSVTEIADPAEAVINTESKSEAATESVNTADTTADKVETKNKIETKTDEKSETAQDTKTDTKQDTKTDTKQDVSSDVKSDPKTEEKTETVTEETPATTEVVTPVVEIYAGISKEDAYIKASSAEGPVSTGDSEILGASKGSSPTGEDAWILQTTPVKSEESENVQATYYVSASFCTVEYNNLESD